MRKLHLFQSPRDFLIKLRMSSLAITEKVAKKEQAAKVGEIIAKKAAEAGIKDVVFDRNGYLYHGRIKELADAARNGGLNF